MVWQIQIPNGQRTFVDQNGFPLAGGSVFHYVPGTTAPATTFIDPDLTVPNTNPITLDSAGRAIIWGDTTYRQIVTDRFGNLVWDQVTGLSSVPGPGDFTTIHASSDVTFDSNLSVGGNLNFQGSLTVAQMLTPNGGITAEPAAGSTIAATYNGDVLINGDFVPLTVNSAILDTSCPPQPRDHFTVDGKIAMLASPDTPAFVLDNTDANPPNVPFTFGMFAGGTDSFGVTNAPTIYWGEFDTNTKQPLNKLMILDQQGNLTITGGLHFTGDLVVNANLTVSGTSTLPTIQGPTNFLGEITMQNGLNINGVAFAGATWALGVSGDGAFSGNVSAANIAFPSAARFKEDIGPLEVDCARIVRAVEPKRYRLIANNERHMGFIAEDLAAATDGAIGGDGTLSVVDVLAVLWGALRVVLDALERRP